MDKRSVCRRNRARFESFLLLLLLVGSSCGAPTTMPPQGTAVPPTPVATIVPSALPTAVPTARPAAVPTETPRPTSTPTQVPPTVTPAAVARYQLTFEATWSVETHRLDFPPNPHFSGLIGATHRPDLVLWQVGELATPGIRNMAETGQKSPLDSEIEVLIDQGGACALISGGGINPSPGVVTVTFTVTLDCPLVSVVSMIAPSPDWFVGVSGLSLLQEGAWVDELIVELQPYDAGTDSGLTYTSPDQPTENPEGIYHLEEEPLQIDGRVPSLGTFTFTLLDG